MRKAQKTADGGLLRVLLEMISQYLFLLTGAVHLVDIYGVNIRQGLK
jgi:hypothetical protein